jgi:hypothetical protein
MGVVSQKMSKQSEQVEVDFAAPMYAMMKADRGAMSKGAASRVLIITLVSAKYPQQGGGMKLADGRIWAAWQEVFVESEDSGSDGVMVTVGQLEWLIGILKDETVGLPAGLAQWRLALLDYLESVG